jgi:signal transduction histidine kinase/DNA-binding response OmpR family regulator
MLQPGCDHAVLLLRPFLLYVALHLIVTSAAAQSPIKLDPSADKYPISCCVEFLEDPSNALTFNDVNGPSYNDKFKKSTGSLNFGYSSSSYWMRFQIQNLDSLPPQGWVLERSNPIFELARLYVISDSGDIIYKELKAETPVHEREVQTRAVVFNLPDQPGKTYTVYLMLSGKDNKMYDLVIWSREAYNAYLRITDGILSFYFGILFALAIYNLFLFFSLRDRSYLYYTLLVSCMASSQLVLTGWGAEYLGLAILKEQISSIVFPTLAVVFGVLFTVHFLSIRQHYPTFHRCVIGLMFITVIVACFGFYPPFFSIVLRITSLFMAILALALLVSSIPLVIAGQRAARFYLLGWSVLGTAVCIMHLKHLGYLPVNPVTRYAMKFASVFEAIVFSFGLADRFHTTSMQLKLKNLEVQKLAESEKMKSDFFSNITHEFRTPLMLISGHIKALLHNPKLASLDRERLEVADKNTTHLNRLISQLLDIAKVDAGMLKVIPQPVNIDEFFKLIRATFISLSEHKRVSFETDIQVPTAAILIDDDKLEKITYNLLSNAFKFTPEGGKVTLRVSEEKQEIVIQVSDTGIGIAEQHLPLVFDKFFQVEKNALQGSDGTGIGLALVKELVTLLGGSINVVSKINEGSTFTVHIPFEKTALPVTTNGHHTEPTSTIFIEESDELFDIPQAHASTVLIVEDNDDLQRYMTLGLKDKYNILSARNGEEGFDLAKKHLPDIILTDWMMPHVNGVTLCRLLKADELTNHVPVILITAKADAESKLEALETGADDYLYKPFDFDEVLLKISNRISNQKLIQEKLRHTLLSEPTSLKTVVSEDERFLFSFKEAVEKNLSDQQLSVELLRKEMGMSRVQLSRKVNALIGIPINEYIRILRLKRAATLLSEQFGSVSDVAYEVGFTNLSYFSKCFKEQFGKTPSEYAET